MWLSGQITGQCAEKWLWWELENRNPTFKQFNTVIAPFRNSRSLYPFFYFPVNLQTEHDFFRSVIMVKMFRKPAVYLLTAYETTYLTGELHHG